MKLYFKRKELLEQQRVLQTLSLFERYKFKHLDWQPLDLSPRHRIRYFYYQCNKRIGIVVAYYNAFNIKGESNTNYLQHCFDLLVGEYQNIFDAFDTNTTNKKGRWLKFWIPSFNALNEGHKYILESLVNEKETDTELIERKYRSIYKTIKKYCKKETLEHQDIMATSTQQKQELFKSIWAIANELRGSVDGWDFKQYVLGMLFYRYISENITTYINNLQHKAGFPDFNYADFDDEQAESARDSIVAEKGFFILPSQLFCNVRKHAAKDDNLNMTLAAAFKSIEASAVGTDSEDDMKGLFDDLDVNSSKLGSSVAKRNERLVKILDAVGDMNLGGPQDNKIDAFGDAYEFLMKMYAGNAGKSGGEYFTPQEVSELLARIATLGKNKVRKVYDPACGSGSLLMQVAKVIGKENVQQGFFGQEINQTTFNLCRINMFLHDINYNHFDIALGDTLLDPKHRDDEPFDVIVSNPPYSIKWKGDEDPVLINDERFAPAGVLAPKSKADLAFTMHMLSSLSADGAAAIVEFPGVLYRGGAEQKIRQYLVDNDFVDAVIQLPQNLFFGVSIATCIIVLRKNKLDNKVLFIDASNEFIHEGNKNKLSEENIQHILQLYTNREDVAHQAALVPQRTIADNGFNLSVNSYVEQEDTREEIDIDQLNAELREIVARENELRKQIEELIANL